MPVAVKPVMNPDLTLDLPHARHLARELLQLHADPVHLPGSTPDDDLHLALHRALSTYSDNATLLTRTAHTLAESALSTIRDIEDTDGNLAHRLAAQETLT